jgi:hypothetical protein
VGREQGLRGFVRRHVVLLTAFIPAYDIENYNFDIALSFIKRRPGLPVCSLPHSNLPLASDRK